MPLHGMIPSHAAPGPLSVIQDISIIPDKKKSALPPSAEREKIEREIAVTDENIDEIVYGLYGVTDEERKRIENS